MSWLCTVCGQEFEHHKEYKNHPHGVVPTAPEDTNIPPVQEKAQNEASSEVVQISEPIKTNPIRLKYLYEGDCPNCRRGVSTLELDVASKHYVVAYCVFCKNQHEQREVVKL